MLRLVFCFSLLSFFTTAVAAKNLAELEALMQQDQHARAIVLGEQLLAASPANPDILFLTAYALQLEQQTDRAANLYRKLISLHPELPEPRNNLAIILLQQEKYEEATSLLVQAINTHPSYATSYRNLNEIYKGLASQAYRRALANPETGQDFQTAIQLDAIAKLEPEPTTTQLAAVIPPVESGTAASVPAVAESAAVAPETVEPPSETTIVVAASSPPRQDPVAAAAETVAASAVTETEEPTATDTRTPEPVVETPVETVALAAPAAAPVATVNINSDEFLEQRIIAWANAWSSKAFDDYISYYSGDFSPRFETHRAWVEHRRGRIMRPGEISVDVSNISIRARGQNRVVIDFDQRYESSTYRDQVRKRIVMGRFDDQWKITAERVLSVL